MSKVIIAIKVGFTAIVGGLSVLLGGFDALIICLCSLVIFDYITGVFCGIIQKKLNSRTGFIGIIKKVCIFLVVAVANSIGDITGISGLRDIAVSFYIANEGISIVENLGIIGVPLPKKLIEILEQLKNK
ncbi:MAG: phage holin family protein [Clostridia bacterium]|nr:phage holin family protein [Clostridia bacterium]